MHAAAACRVFAAYEKRFFDARSGWTGWENCLTVDILRRLNSSEAVGFADYPEQSTKFDIWIRNPRTAVEIKVPGDDAEVAKFAKKGAAKISGRLASDAMKLEPILGSRIGILFLAVEFQSNALAAQYQKLVQSDLRNTYVRFPRAKCINCNSKDGHMSLLALCSDELT